jgi:aldehyde dehydrogenase (NAD+)
MLSGYFVRPTVFADFGDQARAERIAARLESGRVVINGAAHEPLARFGGTKQSGLGRENGPFGLDAYLEPKTLLGAILA